MKKALLVLSAILLLTVLVVGVSVSASAEVVGGECGADGDNVTWSFDTSTLTLTISGEGDMRNYPRGDAPWCRSDTDLIVKVVIEDGVTGIGEWAFYYCTSLRSIEIPDSVTSIGSSAFEGCRNLTSIKLPSLTMIEGGLFLDCYHLKTVYIPTSVKMLKNGAFSDTALKTVIYCGTEAQWNAIAKVTNWDGGKNPTVQYHEYDLEAVGENLYKGVCIHCGVETETSTNEPSTNEPSTNEPSTNEPSTDEPSTNEPSTNEPSTDEPATDAPTSEVQDQPFGCNSSATVGAGLMLLMALGAAGVCLKKKKF